MGSSRLLLPFSLLGCSLLLLASCRAEPQPSPSPTPGIRPLSGGFGGHLQEAATFGVLLVTTDEQPSTLDFVAILCAPDQRLEQAVVLTETVRLQDGKFSIATEQLSVQGEFVSPSLARGTVHTLVPLRAGCGIPEVATWESTCDRRVEKAPEEKHDTGSLVLGSAWASGDQGRSLAWWSLHLSGYQFMISSPESGSCAQP